MKSRKMIPFAIIMSLVIGLIISKSIFFIVQEQVVKPFESNHGIYWSIVKKLTTDSMVEIETINPTRYDFSKKQLTFFVKFADGKSLNNIKDKLVKDEVWKYKNNIFCKSSEAGVINVELVKNNIIMLYTNEK